MDGKRTKTISFLLIMLIFTNIFSEPLYANGPKKQKASKRNQNHVILID